MTIEVKLDALDRDVNLLFSGVPGDTKQPVRHVYFSVDISRAAAIRLRNRITKVLAKEKP